MDPADQESKPAPIGVVVAQQGILLGQHKANIRALVEANQALANQVSALTSQLSSLLASQAPATPPAEPEDDPPRDIHPFTPERFGGQPHLCWGFLFHCSLQFKLRPVSFTSDLAKIHYILGLLRGKALTWAEARFAREALEGVSYHEEFKLVFDRPNAHFCASSSLLKLSQGRHTVEEYTLEFRMLDAEVDWTQDTLRAVFINGLSEQMKDELASRDDPQELNDLITLVLCIDAQLQLREHYLCSSFPAPGLQRLRHGHARNSRQRGADADGESSTYIGGAGPSQSVSRSNNQTLEDGHPTACLSRIPSARVYCSGDRF
ncbi:hypothetical protein L3Q82_006634 [Scortum barcoo]|uniref:Uncharacterized protein n=1 Tax=Scortum barcoo TaxID=214431 RepID=A0ACB8X196_9TELE|nr:hypothetical protein L3Q82_006634 [Scortum barcoo]